MPYGFCGLVREGLVLLPVQVSLCWSVRGCRERCVGRNWGLGVEMLFVVRLLSPCFVKVKNFLEVWNRVVAANMKGTGALLKRYFRKVRGV